jgi:site-specific recombinase XerD
MLGHVSISTTQVYQQVNIRDPLHELVEAGTAL